MKHLVELHPWDIAEEGTEQTLAQVASLGVDGVSLTASWPGRAVLRPRAPAGRLYVPERGSVYFRPDETRWSASPLKPHAAELVLMEDYFDTLPIRAQREGLSVEARVVFVPYVPPPRRAAPRRERSVTGRLLPPEKPFQIQRLFVRNAFGDRLPGYLCPAHEEVRAYFVELVADITRGEVSSVVLESYGFPLYDFAALPGAQALAASPVAAFLMGVCFCEKCTERGNATNLEVSPLAWRVRNFLERLLSGEPAPSGGDTDSPLAETPDGLREIDENLPAYLRVRNDIVGTLVRDLRAALRPEVRLTALTGSHFPASRAWREGSDVARLAAGADVIRLQGGSPDGTAMVQDVTYAREKTSGRAELSVRLAPGPPHAATFDQFAEKVMIARDLGLESCVFSSLGELAHAHLKWIPKAIEGDG